jgi:tRNA(fMet)-specific endonuclease VapC
VEPALLDTDILLEVLKAKNSTVVARATAYQAAFSELTISVVTVMEIVQGFQKMKQAEALEKFLDGLKASRVLVFDQPCAEMAGRIYGDLERVGQRVGRADAMIAATSLQHSLTLVTGNTEHYQRIQALGYSLKLENWRQAQ